MSEQRIIIVNKVSRRNFLKKSITATAGSYLALSSH
ncbi:MAG: twin-arginine translocation signal domain-containing protein [Phycisphaerales bacterium]|nr:MAG: twin-arginine translocation signal domain-containing protein [Phycisphaerales bacterium]UCF17977.1 MAG: twin-arginine translocation signal domain-containing protein [Phycisphaerales bacterium]